MLFLPSKTKRYGEFLGTDVTESRITEATLHIVEFQMMNTTVQRKIQHGKLGTFEII